MGKKKLLKEIECLKHQLTESKKENSEIKATQFQDDMDTVIRLLDKHGNLEWKVDYDRYFGCPQINRETYTLILQR